MKFLNFRDKVCVMKAAQEKGKVMYENRQINFFPDFSVDVTTSEESLQCSEIEGIQYGMQFPAKLCITYGGKNITDSS